MSNRVTDFFALHPAYEDAINHVEGQHSPSIYYPMANIGSAVLSGRWLETETKLLEDVAHFPEIPVLGEHDLTPSFHLLDRSNANGNDFPLNRNSPYQSNHVPPSPMSPDLQLFTFDDILIACDGVDDGSYEPYSLSFGSQGSSAEPSTAVEECISSPNMNEMLSPPALPWLKLTPDDVEASPILAQPTAQGFEYENVMSPVSPGKRTSDSLRIECPFTMCCSKSFTYRPSTPRSSTTVRVHKLQRSFFKTRIERSACAAKCLRQASEESKADSPLQGS
ncbi:hypothetical protein H0H92_007065 [Tricholoma furcatifolium]|nr:hypothetical protein H0H92_007065 [Tricholoma furcatifolium]